MENQLKLVGVVVGSDSDLPLLQETTRMLERLGIGYELTIASAHRSPGRVKEWVQSLPGQGVEVIIAAAGGAAHLPGVIAADTILPVIGLPVPTLYFNGQDSLLSILQMPAGIPVAAMAVGKGGAANAAVFAAQILALKHEGIAAALKSFKQELAQGVEKKAAKLAQQGMDKYLESL